MRASTSAERLASGLGGHAAALALGIGAYSRRRCACLDESARALRVGGAARALACAIDEAAVARVRRARAARHGAARPRADLVGGPRETRAAFLLTLNAINFGSGWFPTLRKRAGPVRLPHGRGGAARRFATTARGPRAELRRDRRTRDRRRARPGPRARADGAVRRRAARARPACPRRARRRLLALARRGDGSAERSPRPGDLADVARRLALRRRPVPFYKRAQIAAADLASAGVARFARPRPAHALRRQPRPPRAAPRRRARVRRRRSCAASTPSELLEHGSPEEVEIRAVRAARGASCIVAARGDDQRPGRRPPPVEPRRGRRATRPPPAGADHRLLRTSRP